jgi:hypothetical protein
MGSGYKGYKRQQVKMYIVTLLIRELLLWK